MGHLRTFLAFALLGSILRRCPSEIEDMRSRAAALLHPTLHTTYMYIHSADNAIWPPNRICEEPGRCAQHSQVVVATLFLLGVSEATLPFYP